MVRWIVCVLSLCGVVSASIPLRALMQVEPGVAYGGEKGSARFLKMLYMGITDGDVKSLAVKYTPDFLELCAREEGAMDDIVALHEMRIMDIRVTLQHMRKLSLLLQTLFREAKGAPPDN